MVEPKVATCRHGDELKVKVNLELVLSWESVAELVQCNSLLMCSIIESEHEKGGNTPRTGEGKRRAATKMGRRNGVCQPCWKSSTAVNDKLESKKNTFNILQIKDRRSTIRDRE